MGATTSYSATTPHLTAMPARRAQATPDGRARPSPARRRRLFCLALGLGLAAAGALIPSPATAQPFASDTDAAEATVRTAPSALLRRTAGAARGGALLAQSYYLDPVLRPFSTASSLVALALKSSGGFLERTALAAVEFARIERDPVPPVFQQPGMDLAQWESDLDALVGKRTSSGSIRFLVGGDEYFPRLVAAIEGAQRSIDVRTYIFDNDDVAVGIADRLRARSDEVDVRVMLDGLGQLVGTQVDSATLPAGFMPPASMPAYLERDSGVRVRTGTNPWFTGDHAKTTIIDRRLAFVGGMNIGREYRHDWHDMMMEVSGPIVGELQHEADKAWAKAGPLGDLALLGRMALGALAGEPESEPTDQHHPIRLLYTRDLNSEIYRAQLEAIRRARSYVYIQNAYFSDDAILYELARARRRGVDVRVIIASRGDSPTLDLSNEATINRMLRNGIRVYVYPGMTHLKAAVYDGWACLGSANFDKMSLQVNKEINLATAHGPTVRRLLERIFIPDFARSTELREPLPLRWSHLLAEFVADEFL